MNVVKNDMDNFFKLIVVLSILLLAGCKVEQTQQVDEVNSKKNEQAAAFNVRLGLGYLQKGEMLRAKRKLVKALEQDALSPDVNDAMAYYLEVTKQMAKAEHYYKKAMQLAPGRGAQLNNYGGYLCRQGNYKVAEQYFIRATKDPSYVNAAGAYENAGLCAIAMPNIKLAKAYFEKAIDQDPKRQSSLIELTKIELKQGNPKQAAKYIKQYEMYFPPNGQSVALAQEAFAKAGKLDVALYYVEKMKKQFPIEYQKWLASTKRHDKQNTRVG